MYLSNWMLSSFPQPIRADHDNPRCGNQYLCIDQLRKDFFHRLVSQLQVFFDFYRGYGFSFLNCQPKHFLFDEGRRCPVQFITQPASDYLLDNPLASPRLFFHLVIRKVDHGPSVNHHSYFKNYFSAWLWTSCKRHSRSPF
jgi:hypothetical protein